MLTGKELEKFLKEQLTQSKVWAGQFKLSEEQLFYAFHIAGIKYITVLIGENGFSLIPVNNGEFFIKKIVSDDIRFLTLEKEDLERLEDVMFEITIF